MVLMLYHVLTADFWFFIPCSCLPPHLIPVFSNVPVGASNCQGGRAWAPEDLEAESETTHSKHILPDCQQVHSLGN